MECKRKVVLFQQPMRQEIWKVQTNEKEIVPFSTNIIYMTDLIESEFLLSDFLVFQYFPLSKIFGKWHWKIVLENVIGEIS